MASTRRKNGQFRKGTHWRARKPYWSKRWCQRQYVTLKRSAGDIARECGITDSSVFHWLAKHGIPRRTTAEARAIKHWGASGVDNPMWNRRGELNPRWLGGVTPARQAFYTSQEWRSACSAVWKRDGAECQRCHLRWATDKDMQFHVHHIVSFADESLRAEISNLLLLCEPCHQWVHSRSNAHHEFLKEQS